MSTSQLAPHFLRQRQENNASMTCSSRITVKPDTQKNTDRNDQPRRKYIKRNVTSNPPYAIEIAAALLQRNANILTLHLQQNSIPDATVGRFTINTCGIAISGTHLDC